MQMVWLSTVVVSLGNTAAFSQDCYGLGEGKILIIDCINYNGITATLDARSYKNETKQKTIG